MFVAEGDQVVEVVQTAFAAGDDVVDGEPGEAIDTATGCLTAEVIPDKHTHSLFLECGHLLPITLGFVIERYFNTEGHGDDAAKHFMSLSENGRTRRSKVAWPHSHPQR